MEGIQIQVERVEAKPEISVIMINGYIDTTTSSELERVIQNLLREQRYKMIVDLSGVDYISSAGWGIFISEIKNLRNHRGDLKLANMSANVAEVYELLEFATILTSAASLDEAVALFDGTPDLTGVSVKKAVPAKPVAAPTPAPTAMPSRPAAAPVPPRPQAAAVPPRAVPAPRPIAPPSMPAPAAPAPVPVPEKPLTPAANGQRLIPLIERIREIVKAQPGWGAWKIKGELNARRGEQPKVSWGEVRAELKFSQLKTKEQRYNFSRGPQ